MANKNKSSYLDFLLSETARIDEKGFVDAALRRAGERVKNAALNTVGGNWSSFGNKADGALELMDIAGLLRKEWFRYAGKLNGTAQGQPTPNNIRQWMKTEFDADIDISSALDGEEDSEEAEAPAAPAAAAPRATASSPSGDEGDDYGLSAVDDAPEAPEAPATAPQAEPEVQQKQGDSLADQIAVLTKYMLGGMGVKGFRPNPNALAANGRDPAAHLQNLLRFLQAAAGPDTINPITNSAPFPTDTPVGGAMRDLTDALAKNDPTKVYGLLQSLKMKASTADTASQTVVKNYLNGLANDNVLEQKFPDLKTNIAADVTQQSEETIPFDKLYRRVMGMLFTLKDPKAKVLPPQRIEFMNGLNDLIDKAEKGTDADRQKLRDVMEPLESDSTVMTRVPGLRKLVIKYQAAMSETALSPYIGLLFEQVGIPLNERAGDNVLDRVAFDRLFKNIAQQLVANGSISYGDGESGGGSGEVDIKGEDGEETPVGKTKASPAKSGGGNVARGLINASAIASVVANMGVSLSSGSINSLVKAAAGDDVRQIERVVDTFKDDRMVAVSTALALMFAEQEHFNPEHFRDAMNEFSHLHNMPMDHSYDRFNPLISAMENGSRRAVSSAFAGMPKAEVRTFCIALAANLGADAR